MLNVRLKEMKTLTIFALFICGAFAAAEELDLAKEVARRLELGADFVAEYTSQGELDIYVGRAGEDEGIFHPHLFTFDEVKGFFEKQKHKDLITVIIHKHTWDQKKTKAEVEKIRSFFVARGYKRISIQQIEEKGRSFHLDFTVESNPPN